MLDMEALPQWRSLLVGLVVMLNQGLGSQAQKTDFDVFKYIDPFIGTAKGGKILLQTDKHHD